MKKSHLIFFAASFGVIIASFIATALFWKTLPATIPTHFGISGAPDTWSEKNIWYVFMIPFINLVIGIFFIAIYRYPQYSSWPTTLILMTVDEEKREKIFAVLRSMTALILILLTCIFGYLQFVIIATANGRAFGLANYVMMGFLVILISYIMYINIRMFLTVKKILKNHNKKR